jgi:hypothetical protein
MITVNIIGGLGNQMFQYAFGYATSKENNMKLKLDVSGFNAYELRDYELDLFNVEENAELKSKYDFLLNKLNGKNNTLLNKATRKVLRGLLRLTKFYYQEKEEFVFDKEVFNIRTDTYFYGYWQNQKYFKKYRKELLEVFTLKNIHPQTYEYQQKIIQSESVSLHIRRGDYVTDAYTNSVHGACDIEYYKKAVMEFLKSKEHMHFFIFSDDLDWARDNLDFIDNKTFVALEVDTPDHEEMYLMSQCKHNIIANSSFSWWGAWLNQGSNKKVIAPKKWFKDSMLNADDLIPSEWVGL